MSKKIITFLNSNLGIWLLSSVLLGSISFGYTTLNSKLADRSKRNDLVLRLRIEVTQRVGQVGAQIDYVRQAQDFDRSVPDAHIARLIRILTEPPNKPDPKIDSVIYSAYPEFKERPLLSLLVELSILDQIPKNREAIKQLMEWTALVSPRALASKPAGEVIESLGNSFSQEYWKLDPEES